MDHSKSPLPKEMDHIDDNNVLDNNALDDNDSLDEQDGQLIDLDDPMLHTIDNTDSMTDNNAGFDNSQAGSGVVQGLTPMHRQNIDEARIDEVLVEDNLDDKDYPSIIDIADRDAAERSNDDNF